MILKIKDYSFKTGRGVRTDPSGADVPFTYKELKDNRAIPIGAVAERVDGMLQRATGIKVSLFMVYRMYNKIKEKLWQ